jgi:hypothetical protein
MHWLITDKGDQDCRKLADHHYTRQTPGAPQFTRNGQNLVFITKDGKSVWVTFRPTPGKAVRMDKLDAWECALFRRTGGTLASELIQEAVLLSHALWGAAPKDGFITFVDVNKTRPKENPGWCYIKAGWVQNGHDSKGRPRFIAPHIETWPHWSEWKWKGDRGGKLRRELTSKGEPTCSTIKAARNSPISAANNTVSTLFQAATP